MLVELLVRLARASGRCVQGIVSNFVRRIALKKCAPVPV